jgi:predicted nucleic acid-binding protein
VSYLLDTNVLSEVRRPRPSPAVAAWFEHADAADLFVSVLVVGEIRQGIERLRGRDAPRAEVFEAWLGALEAEFTDRLLPVDRPVADTWGRLTARAPLPVVDGLIAATAVVHGLTLVTRDEAIRAAGVPVLNPWLT